MATWDSHFNIRFKPKLGPNEVAAMEESLDYEFKQTGGWSVPELKEAIIKLGKSGAYIDKKPDPFDLAQAIREIRKEEREQKHATENGRPPYKPDQIKNMVKSEPDPVKRWDIIHAHVPYGPDFENRARELFDWAKQLPGGIKYKSYVGRYAEYMQHMNAKPDQNLTTEKT